MALQKYTKMARSQQVFVDLEKNRIEFLDKRFYLYNDGTYFPSATTILDAYPKDASFFKWLKEEGANADKIRDDAGDRGSIVHNLTEKYDNGETVSILDEFGSAKYNMLEWAMLERYIQFKERFPFEINAVEENYCSKNLKFGGTLDRIIQFGDYGKPFAHINNKRFLIDIKSGNSIYEHQWLQVTGYKKLYEEFNPQDKIDGVAILHLNAKTRTEGSKGAIQGLGWQLILPDKDEQYYWDLFLATQKLWEHQNADAKPRNFTYKIEYNANKDKRVAAVAEVA